MNLIGRILILWIISFVGTGGQIINIECPFPEGTATTSESRCDDFSACEWTNGKCHMSSATAATYLANGNGQLPSGTLEYYWIKEFPALNLFGDAISELTMQVINHEDYHLQIKIFDRNNARYEVPINLNLPSTPNQFPMGGVIVDDTTFGFQIYRGDFQNVILRTVGPLTYEDQFIQITFKLITKYLYGIGENTHLTLQHPFEPRATFPVWSRPQGYTEEPVNLMGQHPYFMVMEGDNSPNTHSVLFLNSNPMESSTFLLDDGSPALTLRTIGGIIDLHIFLGPYPEDVTRQYTTMIGFPAFPPYYYLGFQLSRYGYNNTEHVRTVVERNREAGIPQDIQTFDINYMQNYRIFTYDPVDWGDLPELVDELHADNISVTLILDPPLAIDWDNYPPVQRGKENDVYVKWSSPLLVPNDQDSSCRDYVVGYMWPNNKTVYPDFMMIQTKEWWAAEMVRLHQMIDYDSIWIDMNEPANFGTNMDRPYNYPPELPDWSLKCPVNRWENPPYPTMTVRIVDNVSDRISDGTLCMSSSHKNTTYLHYDVHSLYGLTHAQATFDGLKLVFPNKRPMVLSRSTYVGHGKFGAHWLGDNHSSWRHMKLSIIGILEFSMFGVPLVGADICGHFDEPTPELCTRWTQLGAFYPFSRNHNNEGNRDQDPASWEEPYQTIMKNAILRRYALLPYLYTLLYKASTTGSSVLRTLFSVFPKDYESRAIDDQFLWGEGIMVAPVVEEGATNRTVHFPFAVWFDFYTGEVISNFEQTLNVQAPLDVIPVYALGGSIITTQDPAIRTSLSRQNPMQIIIALNGSHEAFGEFYWDGGYTTTEDFDTLQRARFIFTGDRLFYDIDYGYVPDPGVVFNKIIIMGYDESIPTDVYLNGGEVDRSDWDYNATLYRLDITVDLTIIEEFSMLVVRP